MVPTARTIVFSSSSTDRSSTSSSDSSKSRRASTVLFRASARADSRLDTTRATGSMTTV